MTRTEIISRISEIKAELKSQGMGFVLFDPICLARKDGDPGCVCELNRLKSALQEFDHGMARSTTAGG